MLARRVFSLFVFTSSLKMALSMEIQSIAPTGEQKIISTGDKKIFSLNEPSLPGSEFKCLPNKAPPVDYEGYDDCERIITKSLHEKHPDQHKTTPEFLKAYGYPHKEYRVHTSDGYILTVHRITGSPNLKTGEKKAPIYVNHGVCTASDSWFLLHGNNNLVLKMADAGFDVWLGNARGSTYSLAHEKLHYDKNVSYWDFSFHELALYDVPAVTNKIIEETGQKKILYLGFSMGTTQLFIALSEMPEMNKKIKAAFFLAPIAYMGHATNPLRYIVPFTDSDDVRHQMDKKLGGRFKHSSDIRATYKGHPSDICVPSAAKCGLCDNIMLAFFGFNAPQMNRSQIPLILEKVLSSASVKTFAHYAQLITSCRFQKYSYSKQKNLELYGSVKPPLYDLQKIQSPLHFYHGEQDNFGLPIDVNVTASHLRKGVLKRSFLVKDKLFNHLDFYVAKDADKLVYDQVLSDMENYK